MYSFDYIDVFPDYKLFFHSCVGNLNNSSNNSTFTYCCPFYKCFDRKRWIDQVSDEGSILMSGTRMDPYVAYKRKEYWRSYFDLKNVLQYRVFLAKLMKTLLNPSIQLQQELLFERRVLLKRRLTVGLQLRMNKRVSIDCMYCGISKENVSNYIHYINNSIYLSGYTSNQTTLYISTDLPDIIPYIREIAVDYHVVESSIGQHGHTCSSFAKRENKTFQDVIGKVIADFVYIVNSDITFISRKSSLGRLMCLTRYPKECNFVEEIV